MNGNQNNGPLQDVRAGAAGAPELPRRFYDAVGVDETDDGYAIVLDGRQIKTPGRAGLVLPGRALADAVSEEWSAQGERIDPETMPLSRLANTAIDLVTGREGDIVEEIVTYGRSDLLFYRAEEPAALIERQLAVWRPIVAWAEETLAAPFAVTQGVIHVLQSEESIARLRADLARFDVFSLAAIHNMTTLTGSALLALARAREHLDTRSCWQAAHVDEDWQMERWGEDYEARRHRERRWSEMAACGRLLDLLE